MDACYSNAAQEACNAAQGLPGFQALTGTGTPEGSVVGGAAGLTYYFDQDAEVQYVFNGTPRETTGWVAIN